jgi:glycolate oxidase
MEYKKISEDILKDLESIVGKVNLYISPEDLEKYAHDEVDELHYMPEAVVKVENTRQVSEILKLAQLKHFPVTPRGAGQGLSGGAVPVFGGLVLSLEKMNRVLEIDEENLIVTVEPGLITGNLHREVEAQGLFYPPDPASLDSCSIGGNIAENAGGPRAVKYGVTRDYVCGVEAVLPSGEITQLGGKLVKNVTGYSLMQILIGSEGTLAIITKILLKLLPLPSERVDLLVPFSSFTDAAETVSTIIKNKIVPCALEFMEKDVILAAEKLLEKELPFNDAQAHLLITLDGNDKSVLENDYQKIGEICLENNAVDVLVADNPRLQESLWEARRVVIEALKALSPEHIMETEDIVVPRSRLPEMLQTIKAIGNEFALHIISFGHAGDGNVHVNIIKNMDTDTWKKIIPQVDKRIYEETVAMGGMITGEHGVGLIRKEYLSLAIDTQQIDLMKKIKADFDPNEILNPGKIFS